MSFRKIGVIVSTLICVLFFESRLIAQSETHTFPAGSAIIDMGSAVPTVANSLKPYGLVYALLKDRNVPVYWAINPTKTKDGIDFFYNGKGYRGGTFVVSKEYYRASVTALLNSWAAQGVIIDYTSSDLTIDNLTKLNFAPKWTMDKTNGVIGVGILNAAGIPSSSFSFKNPSELNSCDDIFVLPHADPNWETHRNLFFWNKTFKGNIWAGCNAVSVLENITKDTVVAGEPYPLQMNFLSTTGLVLYSDHKAAVPPFNALNPTSAPAQYIGKTDGAQQNGAESIYLPKLGGGWNASTRIITSSPTHPDIPGLSSGEAVKNIYGRAFNDPARGYVCYQASHNINGYNPEQIAAQRIFLNFSFFSLKDRTAVSVTNAVSGVPSEMKAGVTYTGFNGTASGTGGPFTYQWLVSIGGNFSAATSATTSFTPDNSITTATVGVITCIATDACGRRSISSVPVTILPGVPPITVNDISKSVSGDCPVNSISFNVFDSNVDPNAGTRTLTAVSGFSNGTVVFDASGNITYTSNQNFKGSDIGTYTISNGSANNTGNINLTVGLIALAPSVAGDVISATQDNATVINVLANDKNNPAASNGNLLYIRDITQKPGKGYVYINGDGTITYLSKNNTPTGSDTFRYLACNDIGYCSEGIVTVNLVANNCSAGNYKSGIDLSAITGNITLFPTQDAYMSNITSLSNSATNYGLTNTLVLNNNSVLDNTNLPVLKFDLSSASIPSSFNSAHVVLTLANSMTITSFNQNFPARIYRLNQPWTETGVSYTTYDGTNAWNDIDPFLLTFVPPSSGGTDYLIADDGGLTPAVDPAFYLGTGARPAGDTIKADITNISKFWKANPGNNVGMIIIPNSDPLASDNLNATFYSREAAGNQRPRLIVNYDSIAAVSYSCISIPTNYKPIAYLDTASTKSNQSKTIDVLANDANYYGTLVARNTTITSVTVPAHGTAVINSGQIVYTPAGNYVGVDTLTYTITDNTNGQTNTAVVRVTVNQVAPNINWDMVSTTSGTTVPISVSANDTDPQGSIGAPVITVFPKNGSVIVSGNNLEYTPSTGYIGKDTLVYKRSGISNSVCTPALSDTALVIITMTNQAPVAVNDTVSTFTCTPLEIKIKTNDNDPEGATLTASVVAGPANGTVVLTPVGFRYSPANNFTGTDQFTYKVKDGSADSLQSNTATVIITVSATSNPNVAPIAVADNENTLINQQLNSNVLANDSDPNNDALTISITAPGLLQPSNGTIQLLANGMIRYTPNPNFTGTDTYEYQICDSHPACAGSSSLCAKGLVTIKVAPVPILVGGTVWDDADGSAAGTFSNIQNGAETGINANGSVYIYLADSTNTIIDQTSIDFSGVFLLVNVPPNTANLKMILSTRILNIGDTVTTGSMPAGYTNSSPLVKTFTTTTANISGSDFGIGQLPVAKPYTFPIQLNPGALTTLDATKFTGTDEDGFVVSVKYTTFPTNISSIQIGATTYTSGSWPAGGVTVALNTAIKIFPAAGSVTSVISFIVIDNAGSVSPITAKVNTPFYIPLTAGTIATNSSFCGSGIPATFTSGVNASGGQAAIAYQWQMSSVIGFGTFTNIEGATSAIYTSSTALTGTTYFRRRVSTSGDAAIYSNTLTVTINPLPAAPAGVPSLSALAASVALSATADGATGTGVGGETVDWYAEQSGGTALLSGTDGVLTTVYNTPVITNSTTYYAVARNVTTGCVSQTRTIVTATITGTLNPGVIGSSQSGCGTFTPNAFTSESDASGLGGITYQWQSSTISATTGFADIGAATSSTYSPGAVSATTYYRRIATSGSSFSSNVVKITVNPLPAVPSGSGLSGARTGPGTVLLTGTVPAGVIFDWYNNATGSGLLLNGSNDYTTPVISQTTTYYALAREIATGCVSARTAAVATINPLLSGGLINSITASVCGKGKPAGFNSTTAPSGGTGTYIYQWQISTTSGTDGFTDIGGANSSSFVPSDSIFTNTYYRRKVSTSVDEAVYSNVVVVTVVALPNVKISPVSSTISTGSNQTLTASGADTYTWSPSTGLSSTNTIAVIASPSATGLYTVTGTMSGCSNTASVTITIIDAGTIGSNQNNCGSYTPSTLTSVTDAGGASGITYQWQSSTTSSTSGFANIPAATASEYTAGAAINTTTYYRRVATFNGSSFNSNVVTATVNAIPAIAIAPTSVILSAGLTQTLTASGATTYSWTPSTGLSATNTALVIASPTVTTVYTVTGTTSGCSNTASVTITIIDAGTIGSNQNNCGSYTPSTLTSITDAGGASGIAYQWQSSTTSPTSGFTNIPAATASEYTAGTAINTTTYYRRVATFNGSSFNSNVITATVNAIPAIAIAPTSVTLSAGLTQTLTASGATTYSWTPSTGLSATNTALVIASPTVTTVYTVTGTTSGCSNTASVTVTVINPGTIGSNQNKCGSYIPATLTSVTDASGIPGITYQWQSSTTSPTSGFTNIALATNSTYTPVAAINTTRYYRRVATGGGSSFNSNVITATVNAVPAVSIAPTSVTISAGLTQTLTASGATTYSWSPSTGLSASNTALVIAAPSATTTYTVTGTVTATACTSTASVVVTVVPAGTLIPGIIGSNQTICATATPGAFTSTAASGGTGTINYQWQQSTDNVSFSNISSAVSATYAAPSLTQTMYYRRGASTSTNPVVYTGSVKVTVLVKPVIIGGINGPCGVTKDSTRTYSVTAATAATHYVWTLPNGWTGSSETNSIDVKAGVTSGTISVTPYNGTCAGDPVTFQATIIDFAKVAITGVPVTASGNKNNSITVTITLYDANGNQIPCSGGVATLCSSTAGAVFSSVIDNGNGTYTSSLTSPANQIDICGTVSGIPIEKTVKVTFTGPQGSIKSNGPILATETPTITFTATAGLAPFTVIYRSEKSTKNDTLTNVTSGVARAVALIPSTTLYTLVSVIDANGERRDNNFIRDTTTTRVLAPKVIITLNASPATREIDSSWATKIFVKTKNIGDLDLTSSQARLDLGTVFPKPVTFVLDSVTYSGTTIVPNRNYDGVRSQDLFAKLNNSKGTLHTSGSLRNVYSNNSSDIIAAPDGSVSIELWQDKNNETTTENNGFEMADDGHSIYMFGPLSSLPIGVEADMVLYLHVRPNGYTEPFVMQAVALGTGSTEGATALATSLSNDNNDIATHPEVTRKGEPLPAVINLFPTAVVGASLSAGTPVLLGNGTYNVLLSYKIKNYGTVNLSSLKLFQNLATSMGSPAVFTVTGATITSTGTILTNPAFDGKLDSNLLAANSVLGYKQEALLQYTVNFTPNQFSALYQLRARATAFSSELNTTVTDLSTNGTDPDTDGDNIPSEKIITEIMINTPVPPVVPGNIGIKTGPTTTVSRKSFCGPTSGVVIIPTTSNSGGLSTYEYQWQSSVDSITFYDIQGASADTFVTGQVNSSIYLRRGTISGSQVKYSNVVYIQIFPVNKPTITVSGSLVLPQSAGITFTSSAASNYTWSNAATTRVISVTTAGIYTVTATDANGCSAVSDAVTVYPAPSIGIQTGPSTTVPAKSYCGPTSGVVIIPTTTGNALDTYQWQSSTDNISFSDIVGAVATSYTSGQVNSSFYLRRKTTIGSQVGYSNAVYIQIFPLNKPTITASGPLVLTQNGNITLTASAANSYLWSTNATTNLIVVTVAGIYDVTATDANGCSVASDPVKIAPPPPVTVNATYIIGATANPVNSGVQVTGLPAAVLNYYILSTGGTLIPVPVLPSVIGVYTYYVSQTVNGMESVLVPFTVTMLDPGKVADVQKLLRKAPALQADGTYLTGFTIFASNLRNELLDSVKIKDDLTKVFPVSVQFEVVDIKASGKLIANPLYNGSSQIELLNNVSQLAGLKTDSVELMLKVIPNGFSGTLNNTAIQTVRSPYGSFSTTSNDPVAGNGFVVRNPTKFIIPIVDIFIPTGISPNHDGVNDKLVITHPFNTSINLELTNRWGNLVYKSTDYKNEFEGKGNQANRLMGEDLPDGTYYYIVLATDKTTGSVRKFGGFITLKR